MSKNNHEVILMAKAGMRRPDPKVGTEKIKQAKLQNEGARVGENKQKNEEMKSEQKNCCK